MTYFFLTAAGLLIAEIPNALVLHWTGEAAMWTVAGQTSFLLFVGIDIEIMLTFAVALVAAFKVLPKDREMKILGIPNRIVFAVIFGLASAAVEGVL